MADIIRGSEIAARIKHAETVAAASGASDWQAVHFYTESFQPGEGLVDDDELGGSRHNLVDPTLPTKALPNPQGGMQVPLDLSQLPFWLMSMWGEPVTTGTDPNFTHTFTSGGTAPRMVHIEMPFADAFAKMADAQIVQQMAFDLADIDGFRRVDLTFLGRSVRRLSAAIAESPAAAPARAKVSGSNGIIKINGSTFGNVLGGRVTLNNGAFMERYFDDSEWAGAVEIGRPSFEAAPQIRVRKDANTTLALFDGATPFTFELIHQINANLSLSIFCPQVIAPPVLPSPQGLGGMDVTPNFRGAQKVTSTTAPMLTITVKNQVEAYAEVEEID